MATWRTRFLPASIVEFERVIFCYSGTEVLHDVSFTLRKGEIVGLLGPNGAGKTTTIKIIAGMLAPGAGTVSVSGLPLPEQAVSMKQHIGYVPEAAALFESLTGEEFLELSGRLHDVEEETLQARIGASSKRSVCPRTGSRLDTYSKGMRQKILIAAALLHNPDLVLLDEPLSGLDVNAVHHDQGPARGPGVRTERQSCTAPTCWTWWRRSATAC